MEQKTDSRMRSDSKSLWKDGQQLTEWGQLEMKSGMINLEPCLTSYVKTHKQMI